MSQRKHWAGGAASLAVTLVCLGCGGHSKSADHSRNDTLAEHGLVGRFYPAPGRMRRPAILELGGSEGGVPAPRLDRRLAAAGYPTLALAYFGAPGLPNELKKIPLEYFERALDWLGRRPGARRDRLIVLGESRGAEVALLLGTIYPQRVYGVAAYSPSSVVNSAVRSDDPAWLLGGKPVPYARHYEFGYTNPPVHPKAVIRVERIRGPIFLVAGGDDHLWASPLYARAIVNRLRRRHRQDVTLLEYPHAGHAVALVLPHVVSRTSATTSTGRRLDFGGSPQADRAARDDAWPKLLEYLRLLR